MKVLLLILFLASSACSVKFETCLPRCQEAPQQEETPKEEPQKEEKPGND